MNGNIEDVDYTDLEQRIRRLEDATAGLASALFKLSGPDRLRARGEPALAELLKARQERAGVTL